MPVSTYRLQLHQGFTFEDAAAVAPYLSALGVSHVYSSPYQQAAKGSMHGYDVTDHQQVNEELGGAAGHARFSKVLGENGLGQVLDIVPNHMAIGQENRFWWDVLENGSASRYASFFDIDWQPQEERLRDTVLVPVLGDQYGRVLAKGEIEVARVGAAFVVRAAGQELPVAPTSLPEILAKAAVYAGSDTLSFVAASFGRLPDAAYEDRGRVLARHRDKTVLYGLLGRLCKEEQNVCVAIDRAVREVNADKDALDHLLNGQNYRLAYWKSSDQQLGYRRFFDVNNLVGLRMERPHVFEETHSLVLGWLREGVLDGVRVDHPDGLRDPKQYFDRLREGAPEAWIVGEKILARGEFLRGDWPIEGTSGYDFLNMTLGLLVRPEGMVELGRAYAEFTGQGADFATIAHDRKIAVSQEALGSDVNRLTTLFVEVCEGHREQRDTTRADVRRAIRELAGCFSVYRTYVVPERNEITDEDRQVIERAVRGAKDSRTDVDAGLFDFFEQVMTLQVRGKLEAEFVLRFQQFTSPVMAKGVEDTAFYIYDRLVGMCEVGGDPGRDGVTVEEFHDYARKMQESLPYSMTTLSTHDTKRGDDVRARLAVLSEVPGEFAAAVSRWREMNHVKNRDGLVDGNTEWFLYQTMIGAWPIDAERLKAYLLKAMREAKVQTSWVNNCKPFEDALCGFVDLALADSTFVADLEEFVSRVNYAGRVNSLTQTLLKQTGPGVPDLYQGGELWDHSLVDPDNRRPVDYELRVKLLGEIAGMTPGGLLARMEDGLPKLHVLHESLGLRNEERQWFGAEGDYESLVAEGEKAGHVISFVRAGKVITVGQLQVLTRGEGWGGTSLRLPTGRWRNRFTGHLVDGGDVPVQLLLEEFPVALLVSEEK